jgi:hypothetical protein
VASDLVHILLFFAKQGSPIKLEGPGTFTPTIDLQGVLDVGFRLDTSIYGALDAPGAFKGDVVNRENVGKTAAELKDLWNTAHPTDPVS